MPLPFDEFPASQATVNYYEGTISWEAAGELAASETTLGEIVAVTGEVAAAAVLAEPLLIVGTGLAAAVAADAILHHLNPSAQKPQLDNNRRTGGRIGGNYIAEYKYDVQGRGEKGGSVYANGPVSGIVSTDGPGPFRNWFLVAGGVLIGILSAAPNLVNQEPTLTNVTKTDGTPADGPYINPAWQLPGTGNLPVPTPTDITFPGMDAPIPITPYVLPSQRRQPGTQPQTPINPGVTVWVPEVGIAVTYSPTSVNITFTQPANSPSVTAPPIQVDTKFHYPEEPCHCPEVDTTELLCRVKRLESSLLDDGYDYTPHTYGPVAGIEIDGLPDELVRIEIEVIDSIQPIKKERPSGNSSEIWYAGWYAFRRDGKNSVRTPIHYQHSVYFAPDGAQGFSVSIAYGGTATITAITRKKRQYVDNC